MPVRSLQLVLVNTPIGALGSGRGGGVECSRRWLDWSNWRTKRLRQRPTR